MILNNLHQDWKNWWVCIFCGPRIKVAQPERVPL